MWCRGRKGPKKHCCIGPIPVYCFIPCFMLLPPEIWIFQEPLFVETQNQHHWICHTSNPIYAPLKPFQCIFPVKVTFLVVCFTSPDKKLKKNTSIFTGEKVFKKFQKLTHIGFWVCRPQCTMLELCVTSSFGVMMVFLHF